MKHSMDTLLCVVKKLGELKFHHAILRPSRGMTGGELAYQSIDFVFDFCQCKGGGSDINVRNLPVADPLDPSWKLFFNHGGVLGLVERNHERRLSEVECVELCRLRCRAGKRDMVLLKTFDHPVGKIFVREVWTKPL